MQISHGAVLALGYMTIIRTGISPYGLAAKRLTCYTFLVAVGMTEFIEWVQLSSLSRRLGCTSESLQTSQPFIERFGR